MNALALPPDFSKRVLRDEPMSRHTSWHVGGPADLFFKPLDVADAAAFLRALPPQLSVMWIGLGSNLLVRDGGIRGAVIDTLGAFGELERRDDHEVWVGAGVTCAKLAKQCVRWGLGPAEFFAGIPGVVGGALAMNAGAFGGETWRHVLSVTTLDRSGNVHTRAASEFQVGYRSVVGPPQEWFTGALLRFESRADASNEGISAPNAEASTIRLLMARRKATQPITAWSCGSVFTNPPGDHAARLIDAAGLKGTRIGGACVSTLHANFILNEGEATAADIEQLIRHVQDTVWRVHAVHLHPEVRMVGEASAARGSRRPGAQP